MVGGVIGIGIFLVPAEMIRGLAAPGWVFAMWIVTGTMAACGALCYGELAARFPQAGGPYVYLRTTWGERVAFLYGWQCLLVMDPGLTAALATGAARYAAYLVELSPWGAKALAIAIIVVLAGLTAAGTRVAAGLLIGVTVLKVGALLAIVAWGFGYSAADPARFHPWFERAPGAEPLLAGLAGGFVTAFFSYGGWWEAAKLAGEVRRPSRTLPLAFVTGIAIVTSIYLLASAVFLRVLPAAEAVAADLSGALLGERLFGPRGGQVLAAVVLLSALGSLGAIVLSSPRLYVAMAEDGLFPRRLGAPHRRLGTPVGAIAVQATLACVLVAIGSFGDIVAYFVFTTVVFITLSVASIYRLAPPTLTFRAPARRLVAAIFIGLAAVLLALVATGRPLAAAGGVLMVALGVPVHALRRRLQSEALPSGAAE